jgi:hypothetical protein
MLWSLTLVRSKLGAKQRNLIVIGRRSKARRE